MQENSRRDPPIPSALRVSHNDPDAPTLLGRFIAAQRGTLERPVWIVAVGTDRSTGDALGPLVGSAIEAGAPAGLQVFGTLEAPVHAANLYRVADRIRSERIRPFVVAVDACLGRAEHVGWITAARGPLHPGQGVHKKLPPIGDVAVSAIVNVGGFLEFFVLQNTRLGLVVAMARVITQGLRSAFGEQVRGEAAAP